MTTRQKLKPEVLTTCLKEHLLPEVTAACNLSTDFIEDYEMPGGVVQTLKIAQKHLQRAVAGVNSAIAFAEAEGK